MSLSNQSPEPTDSSVRPSSVWTNDSAFADSAISMGSRTPKLPEDVSLDVQSPLSPEVSMSDRLNHLAAAVWAIEDELPLGSARRRRIRKAITTIDLCLEESEELALEEDNTDTKESPEPMLAGKSRLIVEPESSLEELHGIHRSLRSTVESMRLRQEEQRHLNQLAVSKLESVAQRNLIQEAQLQNMAAEIRDLRIENDKLGQENDGLHNKIANLESEATQKDVAVNAMSSAVAGLEGWMNHSPGSGWYNEQAGRSRQKRGKYVIRGKGRFRGRYYIDEAENETAGLAYDGTSLDARELHDGVRGWLRGFKDVEEALHKAATVERRTSANVGPALTLMDEDWGDFETVSETQ